VFGCWFDLDHWITFGQIIETSLQMDLFCKYRTYRLSEFGLLAGGRERDSRSPVENVEAEFAQFHFEYIAHVCLHQDNPRLGPRVFTQVRHKQREITENYASRALPLERLTGVYVASMSR
jgi:hypothetical protein